MHLHPPLNLTVANFFPKIFSLDVNTDSVALLSICYPCKTKCGKMPSQPQEQLETDNPLSFGFWPKRVKTLSAPSHQGLQESVKSADSTHFSFRSKRCQLKQNGKTFPGSRKTRIEGIGGNWNNFYFEDSNSTLTSHPVGLSLPHPPSEKLPQSFYKWYDESGCLNQPAFQNHHPACLTLSSPSDVCLLPNVPHLTPRGDRSLKPRECWHCSAWETALQKVTGSA